MSRTPDQRPRRRGIIAKSVAGVAAAATIATLAVVASGYDAQEVPRLETSVWVTRDAGQYARVNTELGELDTVRSVGDPAGVLQSGADGLVFGQSFTQSWSIDPSSPVDLVGADTEDTVDGAALAEPTPAGTRLAIGAGELLVYLTNAGEVYLGGFPASDGSVPAPVQLDPFAAVEVEEGEEPPRYVADAVAADAAGVIVVYSAAESAVRRYDVATGRFTGEPDAVVSPPEDGADLAMTLAGGRWVLVALDEGLAWVEGADDPFETGGGADARLQQTASSTARALLADSDGLVEIDTEAARADRILDADGTPAAPVEVRGETYGAWVTGSGAELWSGGELSALDVDADALDDADALAPVFRTNGDRAVLNETATGMVWTVPDGRLIGTTQWDPLEDEVEDEGTVIVDDVVEQEPPVAVDDAFGVRRGALALLPVLLNDHDPNKGDILTVDAASLGPLGDGTFGRLGLVADDQQLVVEVNAAAGSASFAYAASDGTQSSAPATVTLTVVPDDVNTAPVWCGVAECVQEWPEPQVAPGGYASIEVLPGWVDPEGDGISLVDARADDPAAPVTVVPTDDGRVVVRHLDANAADALVPITVTVSDALGATATKTLELRVTSSPALDVRPVALTAAVGEARQVAIADSVTGGSGSYRLIDAVAVKGDANTFVVAPSSANGSIEFTAAAAGEFAASYTVQDVETLSQQTATIRFSVPAGERPLAAPPLSAFVRPGEDATVDVLSAVQNTTGRVLLVQEASTAEPRLSTSVVGQRYVRVSGSTADGQPGRVGVARVVISDGAGGTTVTQLTVFLLEPSRGIGPIAVPDTVSVRAGSQADIRVLANDVSPRGERLVLHPVAEGSGTEGELVFASGSRLRYLAPETPGTYTVRYSTYLENDPARVDTATVTVTVLPEGANSAPQPPILSARVLAGQSVSVTVPTAGIDPDGDTVVLADVDQPDAGRGVASISATGDAIVYRAPANGVPGGQLSFGYTVRDAQGAEASALVRVGVLASSLSDVAPITYSDYVGVRQGAETPVTVHPLLNDRDPLQSELELLEIVPNAPAGSTEYARLEALIDASTSLEDGEVVLRPGDVAGTNSYVYTVQSTASLSTAEGLVVLGVSDSPAPDHPVVTDTVITAKNRHELSAGIDVVAGKVQWPTGDVSGLDLELWGDVRGFSVDGHRISGDLPTRGAIVPFALTGEDAAGAEVTSYGFLRIPAFDDMNVQARPGIEAIEVPEEQSVEFAVRELLDVDASDDVDIRRDGEFAVQREAASCTPVGGDRVEYAAGREAPWSDSCSVAVRLDGQSRWSIVAVPIAIQPKDPQAILNPLSRTVSPGDTETIDIVSQLVTWEGGRVGDAAGLAFQIAYSGSSFEVAQEGDRIVAQARADAVPGTRESIRVASDAYGGLESLVSLVVGIAAPDAPKGATFRSTCDVSRGATCSITAVGIAGEYDPFAGKPGAGLALQAVGSSDACDVASIRVASPTQISATWPSGAKPLGGECVFSFTVADAQGRTGPGQLSLDVQGYPATPSSVSTASYTGTSVTLDVALGEAALAHPALTGVTIWEDGRQVTATCAPGGPASYRCQIGGLVNGEKHSYTARAVNGVGDSAETTAHTTWAYQQPTISSVAGTPMYDQARTTDARGVVRLTIVGSTDAQRFLVTPGDHTVPADSSGTTTVELAFDVGDRNIVVTPVSQFTPPTGGANSGATSSATVRVAGAPKYTGGVSASASSTAVTIGGTPVLDANFSTEPTSQIYVAWPDTSGVPTCRMTTAGAAEVVGGSALTSSTTTIAIPAGGDNRYYRAAVCGANGYGAQWSTASDPVFAWDPPGIPAGDLTYRVNANAVPVAGGYDYVLESGPSVSNQPLFHSTQYFDGTSWSGTFRLDPNVSPSSYRVRFCSTIVTSRCGTEVAVTAAAGSALNAVRVRFIGTCVETPQPSDVVVGGSAAGAQSVDVSSGTSYVISWTGAGYTDLAAVTHPANICETPDPPDPGDPGDPGGGG